MSKLLRQNVGGTDYTMAGCTLSATCATAAATAAKVATLTDGDVLADGMSVVVQFTNGNTAASPLTLTVGGVTANICDSRGQNIGGNIWQAGNVVTFLYTFGKFLLLNCVVDEVTLSNMNSVTSNAVAIQTVRYIGNAQGKTLAEIFNTYSKQNGMIYKGYLGWNDSRCPLYGQGADTVEITCYDWNLTAQSIKGKFYSYSDSSDRWVSAESHIITAAITTDTYGNFYIGGIIGSDNVEIVSVRTTVQADDCLMISAKNMLGQWYCRCISWASNPMAPLVNLSTTVEVQYRLL